MDKPEVRNAALTSGSGQRETLAPLNREGVDGSGDELEISRIARAQHENTRALSQSLGRLDRVVRTAGAAGDADELPPASAAVVRVLCAYGSALFDGSIDLETLREDKSVAEVAQAVGVRTRHVVLNEEWWRQDHGCLIGFLRGLGEDNVEDSPLVPVSLIASPGGGYVVNGPQFDRETKVTQQLAREFSANAIELFPPLPEKVTGLLDLTRFLLPLIRRDLLAVMVLGAVIGLIGAIFPVATAILIDSLIPGHERALVIQVGIALAIASVVTYALTATRDLIVLRINGRTAHLLDAAVWDRLLKLPATFFKTYSSGDLSSRIGGISSMRCAVISVALSAVIMTFFSTFCLALLFFYDVRLALIAMALVAVLTAITFFVGLIQLKYHKRQIEISGWLSGYVFQVLQSIVKLRIAGAEDRAFVRWADKYADERAAILATRRISNHFGSFADAYGILALAIIFAGAYFLSETRLSTGIFIAFLAAFASFQGAFQGLSSAALRLIAVLPDWQRARPVLEAEPESPSDAADPGRLSGTLEIANVSFSYDGGPLILNNVSMAVSPGEQVALVGKSGSGKSTLIRLLLGLERPEAGSIFYDGQDLEGLDLTLVRRQIGVVTQSGKLSAGSIMENIRGATNADYETCRAACQAAGLEEDLKQFPMGIHTPLTEGAMTLSGGQRQRILIARALVNKPSILVFDEATSALDNRTQSIVSESLNRLEVTRIVVAHRLSTIKDADSIYVMDNGRIAERGTFEELMDLDGLFAAAALRQLT